MGCLLRTCLILVAGPLFPLADGSGQDAYPVGLRAQYATNRGRHADGLELYQVAYHLAKAASIADLQYLFLNNIGACQLALYRYKEAAQTLLKVRNLANARHNDALLASADGNLAAVYAQADDISVAEVYARESIDAYTRSHTLVQRPRALITLGDILSRQKRYVEGERAYLSAIEEATGFHDWPAILTAWLHYGRVLLDDGRLKDADRSFDIEFWQRLGPEAIFKAAWELVEHA